MLIRIAVVAGDGMHDVVHHLRLETFFLEKALIESNPFLQP